MNRLNSVYTQKPVLVDSPHHEVCVKPVPCHRCFPLLYFELCPSASLMLWLAAPIERPKCLFSFQGCSPQAPARQPCSEAKSSSSVQTEFCPSRGEFYHLNC